jgi:glycosyltransferase involved in cell wall biosynthesis
MIAMPQVSIIIPAYRVTAYIAEALDSVFAQTVQDFEVIVVNDCCPDTEALERVLSPYLSRLVYIKLPQNSGPSVARNTAIQNASSPYLAFLDADDLWEPEYLETQLRMLQADPTVDVLYCNARLFGSPDVEGLTCMDLNPSHGDVTFTSLMSLQCTVLISITGRREAFLRAGLFDPPRRRAEDFDLWLRVLKTGGRIAYHRGLLVRSRRRSDSASANEEAMLVADIDVAEKCKRTLDLTPPERAVTESQILRWQARLDMVRGKRALTEGQMDDAARHFRQAYDSLRTPKMAVVASLARIAPRLLAWMNERRGI